MTLPVARDLTDYGIRVNCIQPGVFMTPMVSTMPEKVQEALAAGRSVPQAARNAGGIRAPRPLHLRERLHERRIGASRRGDPSAAEVTGDNGVVGDNGRAARAALPSCAGFRGRG